MNPYPSTYTVVTQSTKTYVPFETTKGTIFLDPNHITGFRKAGDGTTLFMSKESDLSHVDTLDSVDLVASLLGCPMMDHGDTHQEKELLLEKK